MNPDYEKYRGKKGEDKRAVNVLVPGTLHSALEFIANSEGDSFSGMVLEGLGRVFEDRKTDPEFTTKFLASLDEQAKSIEQTRQQFLDSDLNGS